MEVSRAGFDEAVERGIIDAAQRDALIELFDARRADQPSFRAAHILYYLGGGIALGALSWFVTLAWGAWVGWPMLALAVCFCVLGLALTARFLNRQQRLPAGVLATFALSTVPLAVYSAQHILGFWDGDSRVRDFQLYIDWRWILMELATLAAGAIFVWRYRLPFLLFVVSVTLWYMSMDLVPFLFRDHDVSWELRRLVSVYFGLAFMLLAFWVDLRSRRSRDDFAFWLYLFAVVTFWGGLSLMDSHSELGKFLYFVINLTMLAAGALISRRVFAVFAACGMFGYLYHLADKVFAGSLMFPVVLACAGIGLVFAGVRWQANEARLHAALLRALPAPVRELVQRAHG
jgi:hypothetical protein